MCRHARAQNSRPAARARVYLGNAARSETEIIQGTYQLMDELSSTITSVTDGVANIQAVFEARTFLLKRLWYSSAIVEVLEQREPAPTARNRRDSEKREGRG